MGRHAHGVGEGGGGGGGGQTGLDCTGQETPLRLRIFVVVVGGGQNSNNKVSEICIIRLIKRKLCILHNLKKAFFLLLCGCGGCDVFIYICIYVLHMAWTFGSC